MNTDAHYQRPLPGPKPEVASTPPTEAELSSLGRHGDPSLIRPAEPTPRSAGGRSIAWVRPSELATTVASPVLGRGAEAHATLARQVRRAPASAARTGRRVTRSAIARPQRVAPTQDGLGL